MITPHSLSISSFSGADSGADQFEANWVPSPLAHKLIRPWLASSAQPAAAVPPQATAAHAQSSTAA